MATIRAAMSDSAQRWGADLGEQVVFLARQRPPLRIPVEGNGVFVLARTRKPSPGRRPATAIAS